MAKSKKEIEKLILEHTNFVPHNEKGQEIYISLKAKKNGKKNLKHNEKFAKSAEFGRLVRLFGENKVRLIHANAQRRIEILR
ncbi:hypothetical protein EFM07_01690 [Lactococcus lactis]|jgi:hypothetical protein|uniref:hypothetical protein n=1 Tax=Lactococcus TaxID=1357 RepID=UPI001CDD3B5D|nr:MULTISPECIES: hypothetical protein [Lactococcus]MCA2388976.1 hypothetical protein [Lactococcus sp. NH2-7C]MCI1071191.1 hypothetical protein [Lactococcus lactis]MCT1182761.1 hypothetical protein [Lactococcus lactis]MCT1193890.1 hypothetical protein [Lactococcus lactis]MCT1226281.1 hypothetical protein [Lactococcus lactis]